MFKLSTQFDLIQPVLVNSLHVARRSNCLSRSRADTDKNRRRDVAWRLFDARRTCTFQWQKQKLENCHIYLDMDIERDAVVRHFPFDPSIIHAQPTTRRHNYTPSRTTWMFSAADKSARIEGCTSILKVVHNFNFRRKK
jgi:hypothetical protein